jgi:formylglycine-generating enzyme required for sulfatase activity
MNVDCFSMHHIKPDRSAEACTVLLAVIGPGWLDARDSAGRRRLDNPDDFVRIEIAAALQRNIMVVPILIDTAPMPEVDLLPDLLKPLTWRNAFVISHSRFASDVGRLAQTLDPAPMPEQRAGPLLKAKLITPNYLPAPGTGKTEWFKDIDVGPELVVVPAGSFTMGSWHKNRGSWRDESDEPPHKVTICKPFAVGRFAITFEEWDATGLSYMPGDEGWGRGRQPVTNISWDDARDYVKWLSQSTGKAYRLLTEAEWEYCCWAGATTYSYDEISRAVPDGPDDWDKPGMVGRFPPNAWGLCDMIGSIWEWVEDNWHPNYRGAPANEVVWTGGDASLRVIRGGSAERLTVDELRPGMRGKESPSQRHSLIGFRVGRMLTP